MLPFASGNARGSLLCCSCCHGSATLVIRCHGSATLGQTLPRPAYAGGDAGLGTAMLPRLCYAWGDAATARLCWRGRWPRYCCAGRTLPCSAMLGRRWETLPRLCYAGETLRDAGPRGEQGGGRPACYAAGVVRFSAVTPRTSHLSSGLVKCRIPSGCLPYIAGSEPFSRVSCLQVGS